MNLEALNRTSADLLPAAWQMLWQSSLLIVVIGAMDFALRRKLRASVRYALWLVALVKLLLPPALAVPTGIAWWLRTSPPAHIALPREIVVTVSDHPIAPPPLLIQPDVPPPAPQLSLQAWTLISAASITAALFVWLMVRWVHVSRMVRLANDAGDSVQRIFQEASGCALKSAKRVRVRVTKERMSPAVCGLFRPVILLPESLANNLTPTQLRAVLIHELFHLKRRDVWVNCLQALQHIVYWWHPLVWIANARIRRLREEAVDDAVMLGLREDADCYASTLLEVAKLAFHRPLASLGLVGILESRSALRQRIERLIDFKTPRRAGLSFSSLIAITAFTAAAVPMGEAPRKSVEIERVTTVQPKTITNNSAIALVSQNSNGFDWLPGEGFPEATIETNESDLISRWYILDMEKVCGAIGLASNTNTLSETKSGSEFLSAFFRYFQSAGVDLSVRPRNVFYHADGRIWIRATEEDLDHFEQIAEKNHLLQPRSSMLNNMVAVRVQDARLLLEMGKLDDAEAKLRGALKIDPTNPAAIYYLSLVEQARIHTNSPGTGHPSENLIRTRSNRQTILKKLNQIRFDQISFDHLPLSEVLRTLSRQVKQRDPDHAGINFLLNPQNASTPAATIDPITGLPTTPPSNTGPTDLNDISITLPPLTNVSLADVLDAIVTVSKTPLKYSILDYAVVFSIKSGSDTLPLRSRRFKVDPNTFKQGLEGASGLKLPEPAQTGSMSNFQNAILSYFKSLGVNMEPPKSVFFSDTRGELLVRATDDDLDLIEQAIQKLNTAPPQVNIRVKFIEMPKELADTVCPSGTTVTNGDGVLGILTGPAAKQLLARLKSAPAVNELSEGSVTTLCGRQTQLRVVDSTINVVVGVSNGVPGTKRIPIGAVLDAIPYASDDGHTIRMTVIPEFTEFLGYETPETANADGQQVPLPHFRIRQVKTSAVVRDGQTLVLGRLPQTEQIVSNTNTSASVTVEDPSRTLLVFVTPRLIDPAGNPIHSDE